MTVLVQSIVGHIHVTLTDLLSLQTTEVDSLLLGVVLHNVNDRETVNSKQVSVGSLPDCAGSRGVVVEIHTHTRLLRTLSSEHVDSSGLADFSGTLDNLLTSRVDSGDLHKHVAVAHAYMLELHSELIARENHPHKLDVITSITLSTGIFFGLKKINLRQDAIRPTLRSNVLNEAAGSCAGPHSVGDGARKGREV